MMKDSECKSRNDHYRVCNWKVYKLFCNDEKLLRTNGLGTSMNEANLVMTITKFVIGSRDTASFKLTKGQKPQVRTPRDMATKRTIYFSEPLQSLLSVQTIL